MCTPSLEVGGWTDLVITNGKLRVKLITLKAQLEFTYPAIQLIRVEEAQ